MILRPSSPPPRPDAPRDVVFEARCAGCPKLMAWASTPTGGTSGSFTRPVGCGCGTAVSVEENTSAAVR